MNAMPDIVSRYLEDRESLTAAELAELVETLTDDPALAGQVRSELIVEEMLTQKLAAYRGDFRVQVQQRLRDHAQGEEELDRRAEDLRTLASRQLQQKQQSEQRSKRFKLWTSLAAAVLFCCAAAGGFYFYYQQQTVGYITEVAGNAHVIRNGEKTPLERDMRIAIGDRVETPAGAAVTLRYVDGGVLRIGGDTVAGFPVLQHPSGAVGKLVNLQRGDLMARMGPQKLPMVLTTKVAYCEVIGTQFFLSTNRENTRLEVSAGKVKFTHDSLPESVLVTGGQTGVATASGLKNQTEPWPAARKGLVFVFQTADRARQLWNPETGDLQMYDLQPAGDAMWTHDYAMQFASGQFTTPPSVNDLIRHSTARTGAISLEAIVQFDKSPQKEPVQIVSMGDGQASSFALVRRHKEVYFELYADGKAIATSKLSGKMMDYRQHHIAVTAGNGELTGYVDGRKVMHSSYPTGKFTIRKNDTLKFGDRRGRARTTLESVALYNEKLSPEDIASNARTSLMIVRARPAVPQLEILARVQKQSVLPANGPPQAKSSLMVTGVEVMKTFRGKPEDEILLISHWATLNGNRQPLLEAQPGDIFRLVLESRDNNPQLFSVPEVNHFTSEADRKRTIYYVVDAEKQSQ